MFTFHKYRLTTLETKLQLDKYYCLFGPFKLTSKMSSLYYFFFFLWWLFYAI